MDYTIPDNEALEDLIERLDDLIGEEEPISPDLVRDCVTALTGVLRFRREYEEARQALFDLMKDPEEE